MFICLSGHFNEAVPIEECLMDLLEDCCRSVCASYLDPITYLMYITVPNTEQSVWVPFEYISIYA